MTVACRRVNPRSRLRGWTLPAFVALTVAVAASATRATADESLGKAVFTRIAEPSCSICHVLRDAGATGEIGPSLDELGPDAERVARAVRGGVGAMPPYGDTLSEKEIEAVAAYVAKAAGR